MKSLSKKEEIRGQQSDIHWRKPTGSLLKINVVAAYESILKCVAISLVVRDLNAWILDAAIKEVKASSSLEAESLVPAKAVKYAMENELELVIFELDNKALIQYVNNDDLSPE